MGDLPTPRSLNAPTPSPKRRYFGFKTLPRGADQPLRDARKRAEGTLRRAVALITHNHKFAYMLQEAEADSTCSAKQVAEMRAVAELLKGTVENAKAEADAAREALAYEEARFAARDFPVSVREEAIATILGARRSAQKVIKEACDPVERQMQDDEQKLLAATESADGKTVEDAFRKLERVHKRCSRKRRSIAAEVHAKVGQELEVQLEAIRESATRPTR
jgi:hypothetical protein